MLRWIITIPELLTVKKWIQRLIGNNKSSMKRNIIRETPVSQIEGLKSFKRIKRLTLKAPKLWAQSYIKSIRLKNNTKSDKKEHYSANQKEALKISKRTKSLRLRAYKLLNLQSWVQSLTRHSRSKKVYLKASINYYKPKNQKKGLKT